MGDICCEINELKRRCTYEDLVGFLRYSVTTTRSSQTNLDVSLSLMKCFFPAFSGMEKYILKTSTLFRNNLTKIRASRPFSHLQNRQQLGRLLLNEDWRFRL